VNKNVKKAWEYYRKAAANGHEHAKSMLKMRPNA
jgi:TPR repeat protein